MPRAGAQGRLMNRQLGIFGLAALALLAGCNAKHKRDKTAAVETNEASVIVPGADASDGNVIVNTAVAPLAVDLAGDALTIMMENGTTQNIRFGMTRAEALPPLAAVLGAPTGTGKNPDCGAGPLDNVDYKGGLTLYFQEGKFAGWELRDGAGGFKTPAGIGIGSTLSDMQIVAPVAVEESSIGHEFSAQEISGLLSANKPDGKVTHLWAGVNCIAR